MLRIIALCLLTIGMMGCVQEESSSLDSQPPPEVTPDAALDTTAPTWPAAAELVQTAAYEDKLTIAWLFAMDDKGVTGYLVFEGSLLRE